MQERADLEMKASMTSDLEVGFPRESMHGHNLQIHSAERSAMASRSYSASIKYV